MVVCSQLVHEGGFPHLFVVGNDGQAEDLEQGAVAVRAAVQAKVGDPHAVGGVVIGCKGGGS